MMIGKDPAAPAIQRSIACAYHGLSFRSFATDFFPPLFLSFFIWLCSLFLLSLANPNPLPLHFPSSYPHFLIPLPFPSTFPPPLITPAAPFLPPTSPSLHPTTHTPPPLPPRLPPPPPDPPLPPPSPSPAAPSSAPAESPPNPKSAARPQLSDKVSTKGTSAERQVYVRGRFLHNEV